MEKECKVCKVVKHSIEFGYLNGRVCRKCYNERSKRYHQAHKFEISTKNKLIRLRRREEREAQPKILKPEIRKFFPNYPNYEKPTFVDEKYMEIEPTYCKYFGCGRELKLVEKLAGNLCLKHQVYERKIF